MTQLEGDLQRAPVLLPADEVAELLLLLDLDVLLALLLLLFLDGDVLPQADHRIAAPGRDALAVVDGCDGPYPVVVRGKRARLGVAADVPRTQDAVGVPGERHRAAADVQAAQHAALMPLEDSEARERRDRPQPDGVVRGRGEEHLVRRRKGDTPHATLVSGERPFLGECAQVIELVCGREGNGEGGEKS